MFVLCGNLYGPLCANRHAQTFRNPKPDLLTLLEQSGGSDANGVRAKGDATKKKSRREKNVSTSLAKVARTD